MPRNDDSEKQYPNLLKECEVLTEDILAKTVGADPLDIQSTFVGAVCRWQAANPAGLIDITRFWFEQGSLDNERKTAEQLEVQGREPLDRRRAVDRHAPQRSPTARAGWPATRAAWWAGGSTRRRPASTRAGWRSS